MKSTEIRESFIKFFKNKKHQIVSSAPMVIKDDPTLMFTNAGMNQFKDLFLGNSEIKDSKVANSQKCLRVSGKHNDLEAVGHDTYHHTMFEMLGNWSFGDYFKEQSIDWAWEFLIEVCKLDKDRLYVTVFEGDDGDKLEKDMESFNCWEKYLEEDRILNGDKRDNFWEMGEIGPCGPCSEIHYDNRNDKEREQINGSLLVNKDHPQVIEIWNLVFMQYNRKSDSSLELLPNKHVDTGMGFERLCMIMQNVKSNYDTDVFTPIISDIEKLSNLKYGDDEKIDIAMRVIADHIRAISFSIADGQLPSNVKAGYVIRRILRRAVRYAYTFLDLKQAFMYNLVDVLCNQMGQSFPELSAQQKLIERVIKEEENSFLRTLSEGLKRLDAIMKNTKKVVSGELVFELYDTYGFPLDLTSLILSENNLELHIDVFNQEMEKQKNRSRKATKIVAGEWEMLFEDDVEEFVGYNRLECEVKIAKYRKVTIQDKDLYHLVFNLTPFYPEGGGQIGDIGQISNSSENIQIIDTKKENNLIIHISEELPKNISTNFTAKVNSDHRNSSSRNHSATHLLHHVLREELGNHVEQKGSLVSPDHLRFDFTHFSKLSDDEIRNIERKVNGMISKNISLEEYNNIPISEAKKMGAMMLFGEKYADAVRVIKFEDSLELCGGTHVSSTEEIDAFKIVSEGSISAGIRRIEAITGDKHKKHTKEMENTLNTIKSLIKNIDPIQGIKDLIQENKSLSKKLEKYKSKELVILQKDILLKREEISGIGVISEEVDLDSEGMKSLSFNLRKSENNLVMLLASESNNKVILTLMITDDLIQDKNMDASTLIKDLSTEIKGSGGGQSFFATAGGSDASGIDKSLNKLKEIFR
ncbi:MAG: alanine--tRNA ligase [Flavobacteriales bacterium]|nr:alanine--tRNA ligase [Flavobacteriales bacterium]